MKQRLSYLWKIALAGLVFTVGIVIGGIIPTLMGLPAPPMPEGAEVGRILQYSAVASIVLAAALATLARGLEGRFLSRWLILGGFTWGAHIVMFIEAAIFMETGAVSAINSTLFTIVSYFTPSFLCAAIIARFFPPDTAGKSFRANLAAFFAGRKTAAWAWRLLGVLVAFPAIYIFFGWLVVPFTYQFYAQGAYELTAPTWGQIIPVQFARSALLLLISLPILITWRYTRRRLFFSLGFAIFVLIGLVWMITSYWFDPALRIFHSLEVLGDAMVYTGALVTLLVKK